jgi:hypothetical protein
METQLSLGHGTTEEFVLSEFELLDLRDKRLNSKAVAIYKALQSRLTTCIRRLFIDKNEARQAYDFF